MKKYLAMILVFAMTFAMVTGCSNPGETTPTDAPAPTDPAAPEETPVDLGDGNDMPEDLLDE